MRGRSGPAPRRGFALVLVVWAIAICVVVVAGLQDSTHREAVEGRAALARVRAFWAARAGLEATIAMLGFDTEGGQAPTTTLMADLADVAYGSLDGARYAVWHEQDGTVVAGPRDAHARLNINRLPRQALLLLPPLTTDDVADAVLDWIDADDDVRLFGAELGWYRPAGYQPRNAPIRSLAELELIAALDRETIRGEDENLNGLLDPEEDDGDVSWPPDNADGRLDAGWSGLLTALSVDGGLARSGQSRLDLTQTDVAELASRVGVSRDQAEAILRHSATAGASLADLIAQDLSALSVAAGGPRRPIEPLSREQLAAVLDECWIGPADVADAPPGRLNLNTCTREVLDYVPGLSPALADAIIAARDARPDGFDSIVDLLDLPSMSRGRLAALFDQLDVRSAVFEVTSRGQDRATGVEVELIAVVNRARLPVTIEELRVR